MKELLIFLVVVAVIVVAVFATKKICMWAFGINEILMKLDSIDKKLVK